MSFFIVITKSKHTFQGRLSTKFERPIRLSGVGDWEMAVTHLDIPPNNGSLFVMCDLVDYTYIDGEKHQFLDYFDIISIRNYRPHYVRVKQKRFNCINIEIKKKLHDVLLDSDIDIVCVLHFRKV